MASPVKEWLLLRELEKRPDVEWIRIELHNDTEIAEYEGERDIGSCGRITHSVYLPFSTGIGNACKMRMAVFGRDRGMEEVCGGFPVFLQTACSEWVSLFCYCVGLIFAGDDTLKSIWKTKRYMGI